MPLIKSGSRAAVSQNISEMVGSGYPRRQAIAAALDTARRYGKKYAEGGDVDPYETKLSSRDEGRFAGWKRRNAPKDSGADYDLRGAFKAGLMPASNGHWPDTFKKPNHPTFSDQSIYAKQNPELAGSWNGETFIPPAMYAEGGDVDPFTGNPIEPSPEAQGKFGKVISGLGEGLKNWAEFPMTYARNRAALENQPLGPMTEEDVAREGIDRKALRQQGADWGFGTALGMVGLGRLPGAAPEGAVGIGGGNLHQPQRAPQPIPQPKYGTPEWEDQLFGHLNNAMAGKNAAPELSPQLEQLYHAITGKEIPKDSPIAPAPKAAQEKPAAIPEPEPWLTGELESTASRPSKDDYIGAGAFEKVGPQKGSNPGGVYQDPKTGEQWYVKVPKSRDHADNEILAARLYELAGVPVPEIRPTMIEGQPAIASKMLDGYPLNGPFSAAPIDKQNLAKNMPIDAWLANWDVIGTGKDNILFGKDGTPYRIDMGGSLRYRAQGTPKGDKFGSNVPELKTFLDPKINPDAADIFGGVDKGITFDAVKRLEQIEPSQIAEVIDKWGPRDQAEKLKLFNTLIERKQAVIDDFYQGQQSNLPKAITPDNAVKSAFGDTLKELKGYIENSSVGPGAKAGFLVDYAKIDPAGAIALKDALPKAVKKQVNPAIWAMANKADPETKEIATNLFKSKLAAKAKAAGKTDKEYLDYIQKQKEDYKGTKEKSDAEQAADQAEYEQNMHSAEQHQVAISAGDYSAHPHAPEFEQKFKSHPLSEDRFRAIAKEVDWKNWFPTSYAHEIPKSLEFPNAVAHPSTLGFNAKIPLYKGGIQGYHGELMDVMKKWDEKAWFAGHHPDVAKGYSHGTNSYDTYVMRGNKAVEISWPDFTGGQYGYFGTGMNKLINLAHAKNADILIIHNIVDIAKGKYSGEPHTQYAVLKPRGLRALDAKFDPDKLELSHSHAGLIGGGLFTYGMLRGDNEGDGMNKGGRTPMAAGGFNASKWIPRPPNLMGGIRPVGGGMPRAIAPKASPGLIHSTIPGRTDKIPRSVPGGSYIIPASVVSGMGQGNTLAGADALNKLFAQGPYGDKMQKFGTPKPNFGHPMRMAAPQMRMPKTAKAGGVEEGDDHVPIIVAGGEYQVPPEVVQRLGNGNMKQGHKILDELVMHIRRQTIKDMRKEKPPKR